MPFIQGDSGFSRRSLEHIKKVETQVFRRLSSGKRIDRAMEDAAGLAIAARMSAMDRGFGQGMRNLADGISMTRVAEGSLEQESGILGRMRELSIQARNGTISDADRETLQQEFDALTDELDRIAGSTEFNGRKLLDGSVSGDAAVSIENGLANESSSTLIDIEDARAGALRVEDLEVGGAETLDRIDEAIDEVSRQRADLGAVEQRLDHQYRNIGQIQESLAAARSGIEDADFAQELATLTKNAILGKYQTALQGHAKRLESGAILDLLS